MKLSSLLILTMLILSHTNLEAQSGTEPYNAPDDITEYIESKMNSEYSGIFALSIYFNMDSLVKKIPYYYMDEKFEDPFRTLKGSRFFLVRSLQIQKIVPLLVFIKMVIFCGIQDQLYLVIY